jgi:hypothetical protein
MILDGVVSNSNLVAGRTIRFRSPLKMPPGIVGTVAVTLLVEVHGWNNAVMLTLLKVRPVLT